MNKYIIYLHGFSQNVTSNQPLYKALTQTDYGILAIDYRGYGKNKATNETTETEIMHDVQAAAKYLNNKGINNIGLIGHSFGSYIAAKTSNLNNFNFQILVSPMLSLEFWLKNVLKNPKKYKMESTLIKYIPGFKEQYYKVFEIGLCKYCGEIALIGKIIKDDQGIDVFDYASQYEDKEIKYLKIASKEDNIDYAYEEIEYDDISDFQDETETQKKKEIKQIKKI